MQPSKVLFIQNQESAGNEATAAIANVDPGGES
jgi:hypothetical protein